MSKLFNVLGVFFLVFSLVGCGEKEEETILEINPDSEISMLNLDLYMNRDDVQYVDLRNYSSRYSTGYIEGFDIIPFFDYLDYRVFDRDDIYDFNPDQLLNKRELERLFDPDKAIFLYADGCIRSGYLKDALNYLGYERVFVLGGYYEYTGEYIVDGIGDYKLGYTFYSSYYNDTTGYNYMMYGTFDMAHNIVTIRFDILDADGDTIRGRLYDAAIDYDAELTILEEAIVNGFLTFNDLADDLEDFSNSMFKDIEGFNWGNYPDLIPLIRTLYINH